MVINTNMEALQTANNLNTSQTELSKSLSRLVPVLESLNHLMMLPVWR